MATANEPCKTDTNKMDQNLPITTDKRDLWTQIRRTSLSWEVSLDDWRQWKPSRARMFLKIAIEKISQPWAWLTVIFNTMKCFFFLFCKQFNFPLQEKSVQYTQLQVNELFQPRKTMIETPILRTYFLTFLSILVLRICCYIRKVT